MAENNHLKLVSLNIEGRKHLRDIVLPFLKSREIDVLCLQEVFESDVDILKKELNMQGVFVARVLYRTNDSLDILLPNGIAMLSKSEIKNIQTPCYRGDPAVLKELAGHDHTANRIFLYGDIIKNGEIFRVGTTHFTWTPDGEANDYQREDLKNLFRILEAIPEIIICGDFNAPRGGEIFQEMAKRYKDNIPEKYDTSLDKNLHRVGKTRRLVVDVLFTSPQYVAENVELVGGVSDHCAVVGDIYKL